MLQWESAFEGMEDLGAFGVRKVHSIKRHLETCSIMEL